MTSLKKHDLLGLAGIALLGVLIGYLSAPQFGFMTWAGITASVTAMEWYGRRKQRKLLPRMEAAVANVLAHQQEMKALAQSVQDPRLTASVDANVAAAQRLQASLGELRQRLL